MDPRHVPATSNASQDCQDIEMITKGKFQAKFNDIFGPCPESKYESMQPSTTKSRTSITSCGVFKIMCIAYLFSVWDCVTDILVIIALSNQCKRSTFQQAGQMPMYYSLLIVSYLSTVSGIINVLRHYWKVISIYRSRQNNNTSKNKKSASFWTDGVKAAAIQYIKEIDINSHCTNEKRLRTLFVVMEDYAQFIVATILLVFFQDGTIEFLLSWITSALTIAYQFGTDWFICFRGLCVKFCCKCCRCKQNCYGGEQEQAPKCMKATYYCILILFASGVLTGIFYPVFWFYSTTNEFIGGVIDYHFDGNIHSTLLGEFVAVNVSGTYRTDPFAALEYHHMFGDEEQLAIGFQFDNIKQDGMSEVRVFFLSGNRESAYFYGNTCKDDERNTAASCYVDSVTAYDSKVIWTSPAIYNDSVWRFKYDIVYYETC